MNIKIYRSKLSGIFFPPASKSQLIRAIICGGLSKGESEIYNFSICEDVIDTINAIKSIGANVKYNFNSFNNVLKISGNKFNVLNKIEIHCGESATLLRFFISILGVKGYNVKFYLGKRLNCRPIDELTSELERHGIKYYKNNKKRYLLSQGLMKGEDFYLRGDISSQYISGLLIALPHLKDNNKKEIKLYLNSDLKSKDYVYMTMDILSKIGINIIFENNCFIIPINTCFQNFKIDIESDYSIAANFLVAQCMPFNNIKIKNLSPISLQADKKIIEIIKKVDQEDNIIIDADNHIDLVPILVVLFVLKNKNARIYNVNRLKIKESNRLISICEPMKKIGAKINYNDNEILINKNYNNMILKGGAFVNVAKDHRIIMALAIAGLFCHDPIVISNAEFVNKSFPEFWNSLIKLGAKISIY